MRKIAAIFSIIFIFSLTLSAQVETKKAESVFEEIPAEQRAKLIGRLNLFLENWKNREWEKVYDLIAEGHKQSIGGGLSKERFLREPPLYELKRFTPKTVLAYVEVTKDKGHLSIWGCGEYKRFLFNEKKESTIDARLQNGEWYFSQISFIYAGIHSPPRSCDHKIK